MKRVLAAVVALFTFTSLLLAQNPAHKDPPKSLPAIAEKTAVMQSFPGSFADYWDAREGTLWLRIENARWETPFILYESLPSGVGSNDIGLVMLSHLMSLAADEHASSQVRAVALLKLDELKKWFASQDNLLKDVPTRAEFFFARNQIDHFEKNLSGRPRLRLLLAIPLARMAGSRGVVNGRSRQLFFVEVEQIAGIYFESAGELKDIV